MKKALLFSFAFLFAMAAMAQNRAMILQESFNGGGMPAGWNASGSGTGNWSISTTQNAGGNANELMLNWEPQFNGTARMMMPAVDLTGISSVVFSFKHALNNYTGAHTIGIATSSDGGSTWNVGWQQNYSTSNAWAVTQTISTPDMGNNAVRFCIFYTGNSYNINEWYFDDIEIFTQENLDVQMASINVNNTIAAGNISVACTVSNKGLTAVNQVKLSYQIDNNPPVQETFNVNISPLATVNLTFAEPVTLIPGNYDLTLNVLTVNGVEDDDPSNNTKEKPLVVALNAVQKVPMIEHFSSSTCGPCVQPNVIMHNFCNNNPGRFTYTKYQMNWPGNGDPYYTAEGGVRRGFYGVNAVPMAFMDAEELSFSAGPVQNMLDQHAGWDAFMDVRGSFTVSGNTISVKADVMPYVTTEARIYVSVNEKETHNNVGTNGETSFHHIMMKMLPGAYGTDINFVTSELQHLEFTQDMSSTHVEEMSDLEVSIWVQNSDTKEIYNSHFAFEYTDEHPYPVENIAMVKNEAKDNTMVVTWDAPANGNPVGYDVYINGERVLEGTTQTTYSFTAEDGAYYVAGVIALYADSKSSVMSVVAQPEEVVDNGLVAVEEQVALNPSNPSAELHVMNANYESLTPIEILSIVEAENETGVPYLVITAEQLPYTLEVGETYSFMIEPNYPLPAKSVAEAIIDVASDDRIVTFVVEIDGDLLSVTELSAETKLYPNPTTGSFTVEGASVAKVEVYNLVGQKVFEQQDNKVVNIDASRWNKGIYLINVLNENGSVETKKLVVK